MWCFNCDENGRGCKERERENSGILVCVQRIKSSRIIEKTTYSVTVKSWAWGGKSVEDLKNEHRNAAEIGNMRVKGNEE